jgi:indole-3-glycerol phosphate synthase
MDILQQIATDKRREVALKKKCVPESQLRSAELFTRPTRSMRASLEKQDYGIIAEHKRRSPSRAVINQKIALPEVVAGYEQAGAGALSVLTDSTYFGGSLEDLLLARACTALPLLRKEFILDAYQVVEARAYGADAILLIAALLDRPAIEALSGLARELGLEVLLEVHSAEELERAWVPGLELIGVNNRNLKTFEVSLETSRQLAPLIPDSALRISESGLGEAAQLRELKTLGYGGFLMGESFMKQPSPGEALKLFLNELAV